MKINFSCFFLLVLNTGWVKLAIVLVEFGIGSFISKTLNFLGEILGNNLPYF